MRGDGFRLLRGAIRLLTSDNPPPDIAAPSASERVDMLLRHTRAMIDRKGEQRGVVEMRKHACVYIKGLRNARPLRVALMRCETLAEIEATLATRRAEWETDRAEPETGRADTFLLDASPESS